MRISMRILAIDSSGLVAFVALLEDNVMIAEYTMNYKKTHSQTLLPMLDQMMGIVECDPASVDAIAVAAGPGSFTGLRIGSATAKGLGLALNKPIVPVPTLDAMAYNICVTDRVVCPVMDARRNQVYTGVYAWEEDSFAVLEPQCAVAVDEIAARLNALGRPVIFLGDGVPVYREKLADLMEVPYTFAPPHMAMQRAGAVGVLGMKLFELGHAEAAAAHQPEYLRMSQAERERAERE